MEWISDVKLTGDRLEVTCRLRSGGDVWAGIDPKIFEGYYKLWRYISNGNVTQGTPSGKSD